MKRLLLNNKQISQLKKWPSTILFTSIIHKYQVKLAMLKTLEVSTFFSILFTCNLKQMTEQYKIYNLMCICAFDLTYSRFQSSCVNLRFCLSFLETLSLSVFVSVCLYVCEFNLYQNYHGTYLFYCFPKAHNHSHLLK